MTVLVDEPETATGAANTGAPTMLANAMLRTESEKKLVEVAEDHDASLFTLIDEASEVIHLRASAFRVGRIGAWEEVHGVDRQRFAFLILQRGSEDRAVVVHRDLEHFLDRKPVFRMSSTTLYRSVLEVAKRA